MRTIHFLSGSRPSRTSRQAAEVVDLSGREHLHAKSSCVPVAYQVVPTADAEPGFELAVSAVANSAVAHRLAHAAAAESAHLWISISLSLVFALITPRLGLLSTASSTWFLLGSTVANLTAVHQAYRTRQRWQAAFSAAMRTR